MVRAVAPQEWQLSGKFEVVRCGAARGQLGLLIADPTLHVGSMYPAMFPRPASLWSIGLIVSACLFVRAKAVVLVKVLKLPASFLKCYE